MIFKPKNFLDNVHIMSWFYCHLSDPKLLVEGTKIWSADMANLKEAVPSHTQGPLLEPFFYDYSALLSEGNSISARVIINIYHYY